MKLTKSTIDKLTLPESGYALHWDDAMPGFGLRVTASGVRSFIVQKRINGKEHRATLGRYGVLTPEQARREAQKFLGKVAQGINPVAEKAKVRVESVTLKTALKAYLESRPLKPRTIKDIEQTFKGFKSWEDKALTSINREMVSKRHRELGEKSPARANLAMRYLRAVFNFSIAHYTNNQGEPLIVDNPVKRLSQTRTWYRVDRRETLINPHQLKPWFSAVLALSNTAARDYFLTVILTGLRRTEALQLKWADVDLEGKTLTVRDTKNHRDHTLPLPDYLLKILLARKAELKVRHELEVGEAATTGEFVFQSEKGPLNNLRYAQAEVAEVSGISFTIHDLRRTFATIANSLDIPAYTVKMLLNHKMGSDVTAGYIVTDVEGLRVPMQRITDFMVNSMSLQQGEEEKSRQWIPAIRDIADREAQAAILNARYFVLGELGDEQLNACIAKLDQLLDQIPEQVIEEADLEKLLRNQVFFAKNGLPIREALAMMTIREASNAEYGSSVRAYGLIETMNLKPDAILGKKTAEQRKNFTSKKHLLQKPTLDAENAVIQKIANEYWGRHKDAPIRQVASYVCSQLKQLNVRSLSLEAVRKIIKNPAR